MKKKNNQHVRTFLNESDERWLNENKRENKENPI